MTSRDLSTETHVIINDLDSKMAQIQSLPPHPKYIEAAELVRQAKEAMVEGHSDQIEQGKLARVA